MRAESVLGDEGLGSRVFVSVLGFRALGFRCRIYWVAVKELRLRLSYHNGCIYIYSD